MIASIILAHPYKHSFNHAIFDKAIKTLEMNGVSVISHDLYKEKFDPVLTVDELGKKPSIDNLVTTYVVELLKSDILVFIHPNWWGQPPAIMKGYIDRIIRPPHAYDFDVNDSGGGLPIGKLKGKTGIVFNTSNTEKGREEAYFKDPLENIWNKCVFGFCGIEDSHREMFSIISDSTNEERIQWLGKVEDILIRCVQGKMKGLAL